MVDVMVQRSATITRFRPPPHWIPAVALYALAIWFLAVRAAPAGVDWDDYSDYEPPPGYGIDLYRVLRRAPDRPPEANGSLETMYLMRRSMMVLANATRWGEDRTVKYLLYTHHYERALSFAKAFREEYAKLLTIPARRTIDDPAITREILKLREWGTHTALVLWEPIYPRHPYMQIEKVLLEER
jgi:hypothetical protein